MTSENQRNTPRARALDPLTRALSRQALVVWLEAALARARPRFRGTLVVLDIDDFSALNDAVGPTAADALLVSVTEAIRKDMRHSDVLSRLGDDEFGLVLPDTSLPEARKIARRVTKAISQQTVARAGQSYRCTASAGLAAIGGRADNVEDIFRRVWAALLEAKRRGGGAIASYKKPRSGGASDISMKSEVRDALAEDRLELYFQPIVDLRSREVVSYETLLRIRDREGVIHPPAPFLAAAEKSGLIHEVDRWVVVNAIRKLSQATRGGFAQTISINLSSLSLNDAEIVTLVKRELAPQSRLDPARITFEVTETAAIEDLERAQKFIWRLMQLGCRFALDDFGAGFTSFRNLMRLPVHYLKIDGSFVQDMHMSEADQHIVRAIVQVAGALGKKTVAEFVEHEETAVMLRQIGVNFGQGYHFGHPAPQAQTLDVPSESALSR